LRKTALLVAFLAVSLAFTTYQTERAEAQTLEPTTVEVLTNLGFTNVAQVGNETFLRGTYRITLYAEFAAYCYENELSYYDVGTSVFFTLFTGSEGGSGYLAQPTSKNLTVYNQFSLSMLSPESRRYFVEQARNPDGEVHAKVYKNIDNQNMVLVCFEDLYEGGDKDYQDMVVSLEFLHDIQFYLTIMSPYGTPLSEGWYYDGTTVFASLSTGLVDHENGTRHVFTSWSGDAEGTDYTNSNAIVMNRNKTATANWKTQHTLTVQTTPLMLTPQPTRDPEGQAGDAGNWWYDASTSVVLTAQQITGYHLEHWNIDGFAQPAGLNPITVTMNGPHTATALYARIQTLSVSIYPLSVLLPPGDSVCFSSTVSGGVPPYSYQWYVDDTPVQNATLSTWIFTPKPEGVYYVYLRVTDFMGTTAQSTTARIEVASPPIGGYSMSLDRSADRLQLMGFTMLLVFFGAALSLARRKRK
jgi:hypothetical protein